MLKIVTVNYDGKNGYLDGEELRVVSPKGRTYLISSKEDKLARIYRVFDWDRQNNTARVIIIDDKYSLERIIKKIKKRP